MALVIQNILSNTTKGLATYTNLIRDGLKAEHEELKEAEAIAHVAADEFDSSFGVLLADTFATSKEKLVFEPPSEYHVDQMEAMKRMFGVEMNFAAVMVWKSEATSNLIDWLLAYIEVLGRLRVLGNGIIDKDADKFMETVACNRLEKMLKNNNYKSDSKLFLLCFSCR